MLIKLITNLFISIFATLGVIVTLLLIYFIILDKLKKFVHNNSAVSISEHYTASKAIDRFKYPSRNIDTDFELWIKVLINEKIEANEDRIACIKAHGKKNNKRRVKK